MKIYEKFKDNPLKESGSVGLPFTPGRFIGKFNAVPITAIKMSCGGGMGGAQWKLYVERIDFDKFMPSSFLKVKTIDGEEILINTRNVVDVQNLLLHMIKYTSTNHYHDGDSMIFYYTRDGVNLTTTDQYDNRG